MYRLGDEEEEAEDRVFLQGFDRIEARTQQKSRADVRRRRLTYAMAAAATLTVVGIILGLSVGLTRHPAVAYSCPDEQGAQYELTFFVVGDWGREGNKNQQRAAKLMADIADCMPPSFVVSTGDNFYSHGLRSANDPQFYDSFVSVYDQASLQVPWYAVLGNHDYGDQIDPDGGNLKGGSAACAARKLEDCPKDCCYSAIWEDTGRYNDARWHCQNGVYSVPTGSNGLVDIIMMDTNPFQLQYKSQSWYYNAGGIWQQDPAAIRSRLNISLTASQARWKFVVGHHPILSFGSHCGYAGEKDCKNLQWLEPELQSSSVAAYFCGHDHNLQYIYKYSDPDVTESPPVWPVYVVSGAGSDVRYRESDKYIPKCTMSAIIRCNATATTISSAAPKHADRRAVSCRVASYNVTLQSPTGERKSYSCQADKSLLEGALAAGVEVPHLCKTGTCGVCASRVLEGNVERADFLLDDAQREYGFALLCTTQPTSDIVIATEQEKELHTIPYGL